MANRGFNTIEDVLGGIVRREGDSIAILNALRDLTVAQSEQVTIQYVLPDGTVDEIAVPSYGFLLNKITALENNQQNMMGISTTKVAVKLPDGTIRTIFATEIPAEPRPVSNVAIPVNFDIKNNQGVEELIDPTTYVQLNLTGIIASDCKKVLVKKVVVVPDNSDQIEFFNQNYNAVNSIDYNTLLETLNDQEIPYAEYEYPVDINLRLPRYSGTFDVINIFKRDKIISVGGQPQTQKVLIYKLSRSTYRNNETGADVNLKKGDSLVINYTDVPRSSYIIENIDTNTNEVELVNSEGYDAPKVGINVFAIYPAAQTKQTVDITVNNNQYIILFFKQVEDKTFMIPRSWGQGMGFYTGNLLEPSTSATLADFYLTSVRNIADAIRKIAADAPVSIIEGVKPATPILNVEDFRVELVNTHQSSVDTDQEIKNEYAQKLTVQSEINKIDIQINALKLQIATANFKTTQELTNAQDSLNKLNTERDSKVSQLNTIVNSLVSKTREIQGFEPKYQVRGFWEIPPPQYKDAINRIGKQEVVRFIVEYKYLRIDNSSSETETSTFGPEGAKQKAVQAKWIREYGVPRQKVVNEFNELVWTEEDLLNPEAINSNTLAIPIKQGENVEIRVKAQSEAGWPLSPLESDWSESIIVEFPQELIDTTDAIRLEVNDDRVKALFEQELDNINLPQHLADQVTINERFFSHSLGSIASPFRTVENKPIPADEAMTSLRNDVDALQAIITQANAQIQVQITDELGNVLATVNNNTNVRLFAGFYVDAIADAVIKKGEIVNKLFYIVISNLSQVDLELLSYVPGNGSEPLPNESYIGYLVSRDEYINYRKFWQVPLTLRGINNDAALLGHHQDTQNPFIQVPAFQSSQVKGQLIYSRSRDITLSNVLYNVPSNPNDDVFLPIMSGSNGQESFIWNGSAGPFGNGFKTDFCVHIDHPDLQIGSNFINKYSQLWNGNGIPTANFDATEVFYPNFMHSNYFNLPATDALGLTQLAYRSYVRAATPTISNMPRKFGFTKNDKYLIGKNTCGAYLSMSPTDTSTIVNNSPIYNVGTIIKNGDSYSLKVGVLFSCRMTDYFGAGNTGVGILGGFGSNYPNNLEFTKKMGIDIVIKNQGLFSFDLEVQMIYKPSSVNG